MTTTHQPQADALVLFGATGDLAKRKLFPALYHLVRRGQLTVPVVGVARSDWTDDDFRAHARESVEANVDDVDGAVVDELCQRLDLIQGDYSAPTTWESLAETLDRHGSKVAVYYMAIPPEMFPTVAEALASVGLNERGRIVVEKPFGRDLSSALELNETLHSIFPEERIYRIDHYLGKEAVEDLLVFRFSNMLLEPVWNRNYVRSVQVTMAESIGVEGRGSFYDSVGAIRDVLQNHLLQVVTLLAMEPPVGPHASFLQDEKAKVLAAMAPIDPRCLVRGQYVGYRDEPGVDKESEVETFVAAKVEINSWRWAGVPWYVRVGKALGGAATEAVVELRQPPQLLFDEAGGPVPGRNLVRFRLGRDDGVTFGLQAKTPGPHLDSQEVDLRVDFAAALGERQEAYERLIDDAIDGSARRFAREDVVELTWRVIQPALDEPGKVHPYFRGSWGPDEADRILDGDTWFEPST
ncbi:MAG: glucose-6-phosphate dehydrogenase [Acidimicrobiia bacterium]|nr:glucose-6-phosphate dehydrogenase [Acidimicrobiia bacterium]